MGIAVVTVFCGTFVYLRLARVGFAEVDAAEVGIAEDGSTEPSSLGRDGGHLDRGSSQHVGTEHGHAQRVVGGQLAGSCG